MSGFDFDDVPNWRGRDVIDVPYRTECYRARLRP